ncbi:MAG: ATP-binding protein [Haloarculaceae archaeon]
MSNTLSIVYVGVYLCSVLLAGTFGYRALRTEMRSKLWFGTLMLGGALWALLAAVEVVLPNGPALTVIQVVAIAVGLSMSLLWVLFTADYTYRSIRTNSVTRVFVAAYVLLLVTVLTTPLHGYYASFTVHQTPFSHIELISGPARIAGITYVLVGMALGTYYLASLFERGRSRVSTPTAILAGSVLLGVTPFIGSILGLMPIPTYDHTPLGILIFVLGVGYIVTQHDFYELSPIARRIVIDDMADAMFVLDTELRLVDYNAAATTVVPEVTTNTVGTSLAKLHSELADLVMKSQGEQKEITLVISNEPKHFSIQISDIIQNRTTIGTVLILHDITTLRKREQQLEQRNEQLDQFASVVSHDLRNPLQVAAGSIELAREECDSEHLAVVDDAHDRMQALIEDLLTLARQGEKVTEVESVPLRGVVQNCWRRVEATDATLVAETELTIRADQSRLQQLLENLFRNAIEHGGEDVTITVGELPEANGFYVEDDGPGIPAQKREHVFEAGYSTNDDGTGLGLNIVKEIIEAHGWDVCATDGTDGGARFAITGIETEG